jgi:hypothetical protein
MMITHTWKITKLDCRPQLDGLANVVYMTHWELTATEDGKQSTVIGCQNINFDELAPFTPYTDLTEANIVDMVKNSMGVEVVATMESNVDAQLAMEEGIASVSLTPSWSK